MACLIYYIEGNLIPIAHFQRIRVDSEEGGSLEFYVFPQ